MVLLSLFFLNLVVLQAFATDADLESVSDAAWTYDAARKLCTKPLDKERTSYSEYKLRQIAIKRDGVKCIYEQCTADGMKPYLRQNKPVVACYDHHAKRCRRAGSKFFFYNMYASDCGILKCEADLSLTVLQLGCLDEDSKKCILPGHNQTTIDKETGDCTIKWCQELGSDVFWTESEYCQS